MLVTVIHSAYPSVPSECTAMGIIRALRIREPIRATPDVTVARTKERFLARVPSSAVWLYGIFAAKPGTPTKPGAAIGLTNPAGGSASLISFSVIS